MGLALLLNLTKMHKENLKDIINMRILLLLILYLDHLDVVFYLLKENRPS